MTITVEEQVGTLITAIDGLTDAVVSDGAERQAAIDSALVHANASATYRDQALGYKDEAASARTGAEAAKAGADTAYANTQTALANLENLDPLAGLSAIAKQIVAAADVVAHRQWLSTGEELAAIRKGESARSYYKEALNTATRGARREMPAHKLVVSRPGSVTIYDMDVPSCPMWMVFNRGTSGSHIFAIGTSLYTQMSLWAGHGKIFAGSGTTHSMLSTLDFIEDRYGIWGSAAVGRNDNIASIARRNEHVGLSFPIGPNPTAFPTGGINDITATVLPATPINPATGLPNPTIAVGTQGGVSVIHWDGTASAVGTANVQGILTFNSDGILFVNGVSGSFYRDWAYDAKSRQLLGTFSNFRVSNTAGLQVLPRVWSGAREISAADHTRGLAKLSIDGVFDAALPTSVSYTTTKYTTGFQVGTSLLALSASAADLTTLVGATPLNEDGSSVVNWVPSSANVSVASVDGQIEVTNNGAGYAGATATVVPGVRYRMSLDWPVKGGGGRVLIGTVPIGANIGAFTAAGLGQSFTFVPTVSTIHISLGDSSGGTGVVNIYDNLRIDRVAEDRSVAGNYPVIVGSVTREVVAAGADLAGYSGFSDANFFDFPVGAMNFAAGDFAVCAWVIPSAVGQTYYIASWDHDLADNTGVARFIFAAGNPSMRVGGTSISSSDIPVAVGTPSLLWFIRRAGTLEMWNGTKRSATTGVATDDLTNALHWWRLGNRQTLGTALPGILVAPRFFATAPTPAQIRAMYEAERPLFQPGAKCLLSGSDSVQGLSYDDSTDLLYVAKAAGGTDVFKGLERVGSLTQDSENALGPELNPDASFDNPAVWTVSAGIAISGGSANFGPNASSGSLAQLNAGSRPVLVAGKRYQWELNVSGNAAAFSVLLGGVYSEAVYGVGTFRGSFVAASSGEATFGARCNGVNTGALPSLSLKEVIGDYRLSSDDHRGVSAKDGVVSIRTPNEVYASAPAVPLRPKLLGHNGGPPLYDRDEATFEAVTTDATPKVIAKFPLAKGERGVFTITVRASQYADGAAYASYVYRCHAYRPEEGNVALRGAAVEDYAVESNAAMAAAITANTTTQTLDVTATGLAATNLVWTTEMERA